MSRFDSIDLSQLPIPAVVEVLAFENYRAAYIDRLKTILIAAGFDWDMDAIEADPGTAIAETAGYREMIIRARVNAAAQSVMLAYAIGTDLDNLAALYGVVRMDGETDAAFRSRVQLAPEALTVAGSIGSYVFHARSVSTDIIDVAVFSLSPGRVDVIPLVAAGDGTPSDALISAVRAAVTADTVRPLTDNVVVRKPRPLKATIKATILVGVGPAPELLLANAQAALAVYLADRNKIGRPVYRSGIITALSVPGVETVALTSPTADIIPAADQIVRLTIDSLGVSRV